jgi:hypothetical protein
VVITVHAGLTEPFHHSIVSLSRSFSPRERPGWIVPAAVVAAAVVIAVLSDVLDPSTASYDPWSWIIWGREIAHGHLNTHGGPAWKPLPVLFTAPFGFLGRTAPDAWIVTARVSCLLALVAAFALARRIVGPGRLGIAAGVAAALGLVLVAGASRTAIMATSEGFLVLGTLRAVDRHLAGEPRRAFAWGLVACLVRPEPWPLLALYGLWLWRKQLLGLPVVLAAGAGLLAIWFLPDLWGSGDLLRSIQRAGKADLTSYARLGRPWLAASHDVGGLPPAAALGGLAAGLVLARGPRARTFRLLLAGTLAWAGLVVLGVAGGFAGSPRYLFGVAALLTVLGAAGGALALRSAVAFAERSGRLRLAPAGALAAAALALVVFTADARVPPITKGEKAADRAAAERDALPGLIADAGGRRILRRCGTVATSSLQVPLVAWYLDVPMRAVERGFTLSHLDFQLRPHAGSAWPTVDGHRVVAARGRWRVLQSSCAPGVETQAHPAARSSD